MRTRLVTLLVGAAILSGALLLSALPSAAPSDRPAADLAPRPVETAPVSAPDGGATLRFSGTVRAKRRAELAFTVGGRLAERRVDVGDRVAAGQVLARLETDELGHAVAAAEAARDEADARAGQAERERQRVERLEAARAATPEELEQATATAAALDAARSRAETALREAHRRLVETELVAPYAGTIVEALAEPGEYLTPGRAVVRVAGNGTMETEIRVPESLLSQLEPGAEVRVDGPAGALAGRLTSVGHAAVGGGSLFPVVLTLTGSDPRPPEPRSTCCSCGTPPERSPCRSPRSSIRAVTRRRCWWCATTAPTASRSTSRASPASVCSSTATSPSASR